MSILDLPRDEFLAMLPELRQQGVDTDALLRQYRSANSPLAGINEAATASQAAIADQGRTTTAGGLLSKDAGATGWDAIKSLGFEGVNGLLGALSGAGQAIDAPMAAAQGLIPQGDMALEALGTAGAAMTGGGAATVPRGSLRAGIARNAGAFDDIKAAFPDVKLDIGGSPESGFTLNRIVVPEEMRGSGVGTEIMNAVTRRADELGGQINLTPSADFGGNVGRLRDFYERQGFVQNKGRNRDFGTQEDMYRTARANSDTSGGLLATAASDAPRGSLRANSFRLNHASPQNFDRFDLGKVGTGEGGALLGRGINLTDNPDVAKYYQRELAGDGGFLYDVDVNASPDDFLDWNTPIASQSQSVRNALDGAGLPLGELPKEFRWNGSNGSISLGANKRFGAVTEDRGAYVARVGSQEVGRFSSPEAAGEALMRISDERNIVGRGDAISGYDAFERLGGRGEGEQALLRAGIPGAKMQGEYGVGPSTDFSVYDDRILSIASRNGERLSANADTSGGLLATAASDAVTPSQQMARRILDMRAAGRAGEVTDDMMAQADPQVMFNETPLPMDAESRAARAQAAGFGFGSFRGARRNEAAFTENPTGRVFSTFGDPEGYEVQRAGTFFSDSPDFANDYAATFGNRNSAYYPEGAVVGEYATPRKAQPLPNPYDIKDWAERIGDDDAYQEMRWSNGGWEMLDDEQGQAVKRYAADQPNSPQAYEFYEAQPSIFNEAIENEGNTQVVFDPRNIRSQFARFDPEFAHLSNLSAANASPTAGLLAMPQEQDKKELPFMALLKGLLQ